MNFHISGTSGLSSRIGLGLKARIAIAALVLVLVITVVVFAGTLLLIRHDIKTVDAEPSSAQLFRAADGPGQKLYLPQARMQSLSADAPQASFNDLVALQIFAPGVGVGSLILLGALELGLFFGLLVWWILRRRQAPVQDIRDSAFMQTLIDQLPALIFVKSLRPENCGQMLLWNKAAEKISGLPAHHVVGKTNREIFPAQMVEIVDRLDQQMLVERKPIVIQDYPYRRPDGILRFHSATSVPMFGDDGRPDYMIGIVEDCTERYESKQALLDSEKRLRTITDKLPVMIAYVDSDECYRFCNSHYENALNPDGKPVLGATVREIVGDEMYASIADKIATVLAGERVTYERCGTEAGNDLHWRVDYIPDMTADGIVIGFYVMVLNITGLKLIENQLRSQARLDALTKLANRTHFDEKLGESIARSRREGMRLALMYLDIDHFKAINDTLGHQGGDEVLREFSRRLTDSVRPADTVARLAGDEFVIIIEGHDMPGDATVIACKIIEAMQQEIPVLDSARRVSASIGIALLREGENDAGALLRRADEALYMAKSAGRNTFKWVS